MTLLDVLARTHPTRRDHRDDIVSVDDVEETDVVSVRISAGLTSLALIVAEQLGPSFHVTIGPPTANSIAVITALGHVGVAFVHAQHPDAVLLVVKRSANHHGDSAVDYLQAGADQYLETGSPIEIAVHIRALTRRLS
jgi:hypothetical protein